MDQVFHFPEQNSIKKMSNQKLFIDSLVIWNYVTVVWYLKKEDRNHYKNYRPNHDFQSEHHKNFDREYEYYSGCGTMELKSEHPCFNHMCECGEKYNILSVYCNELTLYGFHEDSSLRHNYYILFGPDY